jgi:perosamine synthetase
MADLLRIVPGPEPALEVRLPRIPVVEESLSRQIIPVSDPLLDGNELRYLTQCIQSSWISSAGRFVREFEESFAHLVDCQYGVACSNGTAALHLALVTLGLKPGDEVILPAFTMIATANSVRYTGATPVLVDSSATRNRTRADRTPSPPDQGHRRRPHLRASRRHGSSHGVAERRACGCSRTPRRPTARPTGPPGRSIGTAASFSFCANKIITTGEGG